MKVSNTVVVERVEGYTNLACMSCGHNQLVQREQLPRRCEYCRESFRAHGYFLQDATADAEMASQDVLDQSTGPLLQGVI